MKITADDWHFRAAENHALWLDLYLNNGQHALLEVNPLRNPKSDAPQTPEMIVFCELPGEKLIETGCRARWISRPPERSCAWSSVELPPALCLQITERLARLEQGNPATA